MDALAPPKGCEAQVAHAEFKFDPLVPQSSFFLIKRHAYPRQSLEGAALNFLSQVFEFTIGIYDLFLD